MTLLPRFSRTTGGLFLALLVSGCETPAPQQIETAPSEPNAAPAPVDTSSLDPTNPIEDRRSAALGDSQIPLGAGYRSVNDPCRIAGESRFTRRFRDDAADLVACLRGGGAERIIAAGSGVQAVAQTNNYTLFSVPKGAIDRASTS